LIVLPNVPIARESGSWALTYNLDQYLVVDPADDKNGWQLCGLGWYYSGTSDKIAPFLSTAMGGLGGLADGQGDEMFYNVAVNKRLFITGDTQVIIPARSNVETALVCGIRENVSF